MTAGLTALTKWQAAIEATPGTAIPATRKVYMTGDIKPIVETFEGEQDHGSFEQFYPESIVQTKEHVEVSGASSIWTFEDAPWWYQPYAKGGVTGSLTNTAAYTYTFLPTLTADDLKTICLEWGTDTAAYSIPWVLGAKLELNYNRTQPVLASLDLLGQQMTAQAFTGSIADRTTESLKTGATTAYIDTTTIGSTAPGDVLEAKITLDNRWGHIWPLGGNMYPGNAARERRHVALEATVQFDTTTEYNAFHAGTVRKVRLTTVGTAITGASPATNKSHTFDVYLPKWGVADFGRLGGIWTVKLSGKSAYDSGNGASWKVVVINDLATLP